MRLANRMMLAPETIRLSLCCSKSNRLLDRVSLCCMLRKA